jgi:hypothetical protein
VRRIRAILAVTRDTHEDEIRVDCLQRFIAQVPSFERARAKVLDDHVTTLDQFEQDLAPARQAQIQSDRALVAAQNCPVQRTIREHGCDVPQRVTVARHLDLDDLRSEIRQQRSAKRRRNHGRNV